jgi:hypothetical protein
MSQAAVRVPPRKASRYITVLLSIVGTAQLGHDGGSAKKGKVSGPMTMEGSPHNATADC